MRCTWAALFGMPFWIALPGRASDLRLEQSIVLTAPGLSAQEAKAATVLVEEVEKRTQIRLQAMHAWPSTQVTVIAIGRVTDASRIAGPHVALLTNSGGAQGPEGYIIRTIRGTGAPAIFVLGNDARGTLFGVGRLLRALHMRRGQVFLGDDVNISTAPRYRLRGHQLGYRPKTNSYDGWDVPRWDQYMRDLAIFGTNAIELIPPRSDDDADSPHFPLPPMRMMIEMSRLAASYDLDVWIWYPALDENYGDPKMVEFALKEWEEVFRQLPRIDAVFVPGGDPGHTQPKHLMALLEKQTRSLQRYHPKAQMWMSPQGFDDSWMEEWYGILRQEPAWLTGVVFGPWVRDNLPELRRKVPKRYAMRFYPDITHSLHSQYPVPDWDVVFARTAGREGINPRPLDQAAIFRLLQPHAETGFLTYSEGCNDDVNKFVWSALGWDPEVDVTTILREYSRYFIGDEFTDDFAQGLRALERNWRGPLLANEEVFTTLHQFQAMERAAPPRVLANWRFQQALYRAYYDGYNRARLLYETKLEEEAMDALRQASRIGSLDAMTQAEGVLERAVSRPVASEWRSRVFEMAEALYQSIRMQLSVPRYKAIGLRRGANLDSIDVPLNNRKWLLHRFGQLRTFSDEGERLRGIKEILSWTDPGPGGYYDDLGNLSLQPHLVRGPGFAKDPASLVSSLVGFTLQGPDVPWRTSWWQHAETLNNTPLEMRYTGLDPSAEYRVRVVYALENTAHPIRLTADEEFEIHPFRKKDVPPKPVEFDIPKQATEDGSLVLKWYRKPGLGGSGRGCQVAEVWLIKKL